MIVVDDAKVLEEDAVILRVIESYCTSAKVRQTVSSCKLFCIIIIFTILYSQVCVHVYIDCHKFGLGPLLMAGLMKSLWCACLFEFEATSSGLLDRFKAIVRSEFSL